MAGFSKYLQKVADEYPHNHLKIPLIDVQIFTPHSFFQRLVAMFPFISVLSSYMYHMPCLGEVFLIFHFLTYLFFNYGINITIPYDIANS